MSPVYSKLIDAAFKLGIQLWQKIAVQVSVPFATTWLCELGFSYLLYFKKKYLNVLDPEKDLRIALFNKISRFNQIIAKRREAKSQRT